MSGCIGHVCRTEDPSVTAKRIEAMWPAGRRTAQGPVRLERGRTRRPSLRVRKVIASWNLGDGRGDLGF